MNKIGDKLYQVYSATTKVCGDFFRSSVEWVSGEEDLDIRPRFFLSRKEKYQQALAKERGEKEALRRVVEAGRSEEDLVASFVRVESLLPERGNVKETLWGLKHMEKDGGYIIGVPEGVRFIDVTTLRENAEKINRIILRGDFEYLHQIKLLVGELEGVLNKGEEKIDFGVRLEAGGEESLQWFLDLDILDSEGEVTSLGYLIESVDASGCEIEKVEEGGEYPRVVYGHELGERFGEFEKMLGRLEGLREGLFGSLWVPGGLLFRVPDDMEVLELGGILGEVKVGAEAEMKQLITGEIRDEGRVVVGGEVPYIRVGRIRGGGELVIKKAEYLEELAVETKYGLEVYKGEDLERLKRGQGRLDGVKFD